MDCFGRFGVALEVAAEAVVVNDARFELEQFGELAGARLVHVAWGVPPKDGGKFAVVGEQFAHLGHGHFVNIIVHVMGLGRVPLAVAGGAAVVPILRLRIIEAEFEAVFAAGGGEGL